MQATRPGSACRLPGLNLAAALLACHVSRMRRTRTQPSLPASPGAGSIDVKELHVGLLLVYDKLNKASRPVKV